MFNRKNPTESKAKKGITVTVEHKLIDNGQADTLKQLAKDVGIILVVGSCVVITFASLTTLALDLYQNSRE